MRHYLLISLFFWIIITLTCINTFSQGVAINNNGAAADGSAMLDVTSTNSGLLIPRMTSGQRISIASPANGLLLFQTDGDTGFYYYTGGSWLRITNASDASDFVSGTGTLNYVPKWTPDGLTIGNSLIFDNGSKVGIGTSSPDGRLHLEHSGTIGTTSYNMSNAWLRVGDLGFDPNEITTTGDLYITGQNFVRLGSGSSSSILSILPSGNVGISNTSPSYKLDVSGTGRFADQVTIPILPSADAHAASKKYVDDEVSAMLPADNVTGAGTATRVAFWDGTNTLGSNANLNWDNTNSRLGIGITSPGSKVEIRQGMSDYNNAFITSHLNLGTSNTIDNIGFVGITYDASTSANYGWSSGALRSSGGQSDFIWKHHSNSAQGTERMRITSTGNLGIGTNNPSTQLHTTGGIRFQNLSGTGSRFVMTDANGNLSASTATASGLVNGSGAENYVAKWTPDASTIGNSQIFDNGTDVGIGTTSPTEKLSVNGAITTQNGKVKRDFAVWNTTTSSNDPVHIKTNITWSNIMYRILVEGYNYGVSQPINSEIVGYCYSSQPSAPIHANAIDHASGVSISQYKSDDGYLVIELSSTNFYYAGFSVSAWLTNPAGNSFDIQALDIMQDPYGFTPYVPGSQTFNYTGSQQSFTVPAGVNTITIECWGAQGGAQNAYLGGLGGYSTGDLSVTPGDVLYVYVGGQGAGPDNEPGGWNGGGDNNRWGGSGGGASDVRFGSTALSNRVIVAGGGGGAYSGSNSSNGGYGGGTSGGSGSGGATGGSQVSGGSSGGILGNGGDSSPTSPSGGAGGGGYYGGGAANGIYGAGGGGSGYIGGVTGGSMTNGVRSGNGQVKITW